MTKDEMKDRINMALKDTALQQGFEIICKENVKLKETVIKMNNVITETFRNLNKAKEFFNEFMRISKASDEDFEHDYSELIEEAEQFLKEE